MILMDSVGRIRTCGITSYRYPRYYSADMYITDGNTVEFTPYKNYVVAPGEQVEMPVELKADQLADTYDYEAERYHQPSFSKALRFLLR